MARNSSLLFVNLFVNLWHRPSRTDLQKTNGTLGSRLSFTAYTVTENHAFAWFSAKTLEYSRSASARSSAEAPASNYFFWIANLV